MKELKQKGTILFIEFMEETAANHLLMMIKGLAEKGHYKIVVLCRKKSYLAAELLKINVKKVYQIQYVELNLHKPSTYFSFLKTLFLIFKIIKEYKVTLIHIHRLNWAYLGIIPSLIFNIPLFVHIVIIDKMTSRFQNLLLIIHKKIKFIAVSKNAKSQFLFIYPMDPKKVFVHYGGLYYPDIYENKSIKVPVLEELLKENKIIIGMISRMDPLKGVDVYIEAAGVLASKHPELYFIHIGNYSKYIFRKGYFEECQKRVANLKLNNQFKFIDYVDNVLPYYKYFSIMVLPTYKDTLSYVNIESFAYGVPIIFTGIDGTLETCSFIKDFSLNYPPSPALFSRKIEEILQQKTNDDLIDELQSYVSKKFDASKNFAHLEKIYESI